jgi:hypothetical protein
MRRTTVVLGVVAACVTFGGGPAGAGEWPVPPRPLVGQAIKHDVSPELRELPPLPPSSGPGARVIPRQPLPRRPSAAGEREERDPVVQDWEGPVSMPAPIQNFDGIGNVNGVLPPDTNGDVGPNHYVQMVNLSFAVYNKSGVRLFGPANTNTLWAGFGGSCQTTNDGDPIVLYDHLADRWMLTQFALPNFPSGPFFQCIAVSKTGDPLGAYHRYQFLYSNTKLNDYPKFGVWPDAYYMTANQFNQGTLAPSGQGVVAFERDKMLAGEAAQMVYFDLFPVDPTLGGMLPSDLDGPAPPPGSPNYYVQFDDNPDRLQIWKFHVDWDSPVDSTFTRQALLPTAPFDSNLCNFSRNCIPQKRTRRRLDAISEFLMHRLVYRNFGTHEALLVNHTVDFNGRDRAGIRWYEVRDPGGSPSIFQQGTYAPADETHRWRGSIAMDKNGNIALGFSRSSRGVFPSIRYVGRLATDAPGTLPQGETVLVAGGGSQTSSSSRWGDYSMLAVDPTDGCTFWYTTEYYKTTSSSGWRTRIGSFKFASCQ